MDHPEALREQALPELRSCYQSRTTRNEQLSHLISSQHSNGGIVEIAQCGSCGASVIDGSKFCPNCGVGFASPVAVEVPRGYKLVKDDQGNVSIGKSKHGLRNALIAVIIVAAIISAAILLSFNSDSQGNGGAIGGIKDGDYLLYTITGVSNGNTASGTMEERFSNVTSSTATMEMIVTKNGASATLSYQASYDGKNWSMMSAGFTGQPTTYNTTLIGKESINTAFGVKEVNHYQLTYSNGVTAQEYYTLDSQIPIRVVSQSGSDVLQMDIKETNIGWVGNGIPGPSSGSSASSGGFNVDMTPVWIMVVVVAIGCVFYYAWWNNREDGPKVPERQTLVGPMPEKTETKFIEKTGPISPFCTSCGTMNDDSMYCRNCGKRLG
jgi:hypothetical protein